MSRRRGNAQRFSQSQSPASSRCRIVALPLALAVALVALSKDAAADATEERKACVDAHEAGQVLRSNHQLIEARQQFLTCSRASCPGAIRGDCVDWHAEVERMVPSLAIAVRSPRGDETAVEVRVDGEVALTRLQGTPLELNPGSHAVEFSLADYAPVKQSIVLREGERDRAVTVTFGDVSGSGGSGGASPAPPTHRPVPALVYVTGGVAVVAAITSGVLWAQANSARNSAQNSCAPFCGAGDIDPVKRDVLLTNIGLGVTAVAAVTSVVYFLLRPEVPIEAPSASRPQVGPNDPFLFGSHSFRERHQNL